MLAQGSTDWITTISSVAALGAAVAALLTILEMRKQRLSTYKPDLVLARSDVFFYRYKDVGYGVPVACSSGEFDPDKLDLSRAVPSVYLRAFNVGLGAAKRLRVKWDIDINGCIATLSAIDAKHEFTIWNDPAGVVTFEVTSTHREFKAFCHDVVGDVPFILPSGPEAEPVIVDVPFAYVQFLAIYVYLWIKQRGIDADPEWPPLPAAELDITYFDIGDNVHRRHFRVTPDFIFLAVPQVDQQNQLCGQAELKIERR